MVLRNAQCSRPARNTGRRRVGSGSRLLTVPLGLAGVLAALTGTAVGLAALGLAGVGRLLGPALLWGLLLGLLLTATLLWGLLLAALLRSLLLGLLLTTALLWGLLLGLLLTTALLRTGAGGPPGSTRRVRCPGSAASGRRSSWRGACSGQRQWPEPGPAADGTG